MNITSLPSWKSYNYIVRLKPTLLSAITILFMLKIIDFIISNLIEIKWDASVDIYQSVKTLT